MSPKKHALGLEAVWAAACIKQDRWIFSESRFTLFALADLRFGIMLWLQRRAAFGSRGAETFMPAAQAARRAIRCSRFSVVSS